MAMDILDEDVDGWNSYGTSDRKRNEVVSGWNSYGETTKEQKK